MVADAPRILGGRYEVGELIGRGGMAEVHIGHDTRLGRTVAVKILRSDLARDPSFQARFRREAQAAAALNHPAIVAVYDTGEDVTVDPVTGAVSHVPFIVMEYVEGHTVRDILRDGAAVPIEEAVEITAGVLSALEYSHHAGIVHRDIKPANVMLTPAGAVKVMDFGIARAMADAAGTMTQTQAVIGTAQYLSPEQARGEAVDSRSDLYSTGCLLFELLTGRPPFVGDSPVAVAYQHAREVAQPPSAFASDVPDALDRITMKALAKDRNERYGSAAEFRADLEAALRGGHVSAPAIGALGAAAVGAGAAAATQRFEAPAAATQVMPPSGPRPQAVAPAGPGWAPLGTTTTQTSTGFGNVEPEDEEQRRPWIVWTLIGVAVVAIIGIIWMLMRGGGAEEPTVREVEVPNVVGKTEAEARDLITEAGFEFKPVREPSMQEPGTVVSTDPAGGSMAEKGSDVKVVISAGPDAVRIPLMTNYTRDDARDTLMDLGFAAENIDFDVKHSADVLKDQVVDTDPAAGIEVSPTSQITVYLASGFVELPDLKGMSEAEARAALQGLKLVADITDPVETDDPNMVGKVVNQSRTAGLVEQGATIALTIGQEKQVEMTSVPGGLVGGTCKQALDALGRASLNGDCRYSNGDRANNNDIVVSTNPASGQQVPVGNTVTVVVEAPVQQPPTQTPPPEGEQGDN